MTNTDPDNFRNEPTVGLLAHMTRYHYDISGDSPFRDEEGTEHPDDNAAWRDALRLIRDAEEQLRPGGSWVLTVREGNRVVHTIVVTGKTE